MARKRDEAAAVLKLHQGTGEERRRQLYDSTPVVSVAEECRLWREAQHALEELALVLGPLDPMRGSVVTFADVLGGTTDRQVADRRLMQRQRREGGE